MSRQLQRSTSTSYYNTNYHYSNVPNKDEQDGRETMHGSRRVIIFCFLTTILPTILIVLPLYLRNIRYADVMYKISDSDVIQIHKGQSSVFCDKHSLKMNTSFNAFQMRGVPELTGQRKHIRLKKSMSLPDDTLEYWGFYLLKGATVELKACSSYEGSKILVVKGDRILNTCGIIERNNKKAHPLFENQGSVLVTLEDPRNIMNSSFNKTKNEQSTNLEEANEDINDNYQSGPLQTPKSLIVDDMKNDSSTLMTSLNRRLKRETGKLHNPNTVLDTGVHHGGNAIDKAEDSSVSSFEISLHECYHDNILMNDYFPYSSQCNSTRTNYLEKTTTLKVVHEVLEDGYYYYIFYSDNDIVSNDIHAIFDIYKPTFQYVNNSHSKMCVNKTNCEFDVGFLSDELVIVELPTKGGLQNEEDDVSILISVCHPRVAVYIFFPVSVLVLVLLFAFL